MAGYERRAVLGAATGALAGLAGCSAVRNLFDGGRSTAARPTTAADADAANGTATSKPAAAGAELYPRRVHVANDTENELFLTLAVTLGGDPVYGETRRVPAGGDVQFEKVVSNAGNYAVAVETTTGRSASHAWPVSPALSDLTVTIRPDAIDFSQQAFCDPTCPPISRNGTARNLPYYGDNDDNPLYYGAALSIENHSGGRRDVRVVIARDGTVLLDYHYRVPPDVTLDFPGMHVADVYDVRVETDVGTARHDWHLTKERYLTATITQDGVDIGCGGSTASFLLVNEHDDPHQVTVQVYPPASSDDSDALLYYDTYVVQPGARVRKAGVFSGSGHYRLRVSLASGPETTYDWWLCGPRGPTEVRIGEDGSLSVIQLIPAE